MYQKVVISAHNQRPHLFLEGEIQRIKNGMFTFLIRVGDKKINDIVVLSYKYEQTLLKTMKKTISRRKKFPFDPFDPGLPTELPKIVKNYKFHMDVEQTVQEVEYGQISFNVILKDSVAL